MILKLKDNSNTIARIFQNMRIEIFKRLEIKVLIEEWWWQVVSGVKQLQLGTWNKVPVVLTADS